MSDQPQTSHEDAEKANVNVWMVHPNLAASPRFELPAGYRMRFYGEGDVETWVRIHEVAEPFLTPTAETFARYMPDEAKRPQRVMFLVDADGADIGTVTAWNSDTLLGRDAGLVHWVAIVPAAQGLGLAKPMLSAILDVFRELGYNEAWLETSSGRIPALNLYLRFGFVPYVRGEADAAAWRAVAPQLRYPVAL